MPLAAPADVHAHAAQSRAEVAIVRIINNQRAMRGIPRLFLNEALSGAARSHSADMLRRDAIGHASGDGTDSAARIRRAVGARTSGETVAFSSAGAGSSARRIVGMWRRSPAHWGVLMDRRFRRIGLGRVQGKLGGFRGVAVTADLAGWR